MPPCVPVEDTYFSTPVSPFSGKDTVRLLQGAEKDHFRRLSQALQSLSHEEPPPSAHEHNYIWDTNRGWVCSICGMKESV